MTCNLYALALPQTLSDAWRSDLGPDTDRIHSTWLHTPGNLALTGYNPELHNKPFEAKREEYRKSNVVMTKRLAEVDSWDEAEIQHREQEMAWLIRCKVRGRGVSGRLA